MIRFPHAKLWSVQQWIESQSLSPERLSAQRDLSLSAVCHMNKKIAYAIALSCLIITPWAFSQRSADGADNSRSPIDVERPRPLPSEQEPAVEDDEGAPEAEEPETSAIEDEPSPEDAEPETPLKEEKLPREPAEPLVQYTEAQAAALAKAAREEHAAFHEALRQHLLSTPDMTAAEEDDARAQFIRANFQWRVEIAELDEELRDARIALARNEPSEPEGTAELERTVENLRASASSPEERRAVEAYHRASAEVLRLEESAERGRRGRE